MGGVVDKPPYFSKSRFDLILAFCFPFFLKSLRSKIPFDTCSLQSLLIFVCGLNSVHVLQSIVLLSEHKHPFKLPVSLTLIPTIGKFPMLCAYVLVFSFVYNIQLTGQSPVEVKCNFETTYIWFGIIKTFTYSNIQSFPLTFIKEHDAIKIGVKTKLLTSTR